MLGTVRYSQPRHTRGIISEARLSPDSSLLFLSLFFFLIYYVYIYIYISAAGLDSVKSRSEHAGLRDCYRARGSRPPPRFIYRDIGRRVGERETAVETNASGRSGVGRAAFRGSRMSSGSRGFRDRTREVTHDHSRHEH